MIRVVLPTNLRRLAGVDREVEIMVDGSATIGSVLDALEARYPMLRGTIREHATKERRAFIRFFVSREDWSHEPQETPLPEAVVRGEEPLRIVGAMAGGSEEEIYDSPRDWVGDHIRDYLESDGEKGHLWRGFPTLLLTTRGRKTGKLRRTALIYGRDGDNYVVVGSTGGGPNHPAWFLNLVANPEVQLQVGASRFSARARVAVQEERTRLWQLMIGILQQYEDYQVKAAVAGREIPVVILEPL
jgi:deazaflavin-dependent oxidoreductase (nitroreductase family)